MGSDRRLSGAATVGATLIVASLAASTAHAATLGLDERCYVAGEQASLSGSGFLSQSSVAVTLDGSPLLSAVADNSGAIRGTKIRVPQVAEGEVESQSEVVATDGARTARALMNVVRLGAEFTPQQGNFRTLKVRHVVSGFGLSETRPSIYLHYVSPSVVAAEAREAKQTKRDAANRQAARRLRVTSQTTKAGGSRVPAKQPGIKTIRLGLLRGPCGVLRTSPRRLFPFKAESGTWRLQYDTSPRYTRGTAKSSFFWVAQTVKISS